MIVHCIQHVEFEGIGYISNILDARSIPFSVSKMFLDPTFPSPPEFDMLIIMGGSMGGSDEDKYPWLVREKLFIRECLDLGKKVFGVCLGAQLIAECMGGTVCKGDDLEIGWSNVVSSSKKETYFPRELEVLHWHGDTFSLPDCCVSLLSNHLYVNQAFSCSDNVLAMQFHLEMTPKSVIPLINASASEFRVPRGNFVQSKSDILGNKSRFYIANKLLEEILGKFLC